MPKEAAALFSQIEGLLEQVTQLGYDTEAKSIAEDMLSQVRETLPTLREQATEGEEPVAEEETPSPEKTDSRSGWKNAREGASRMLDKQEGAKTSDEEQPEEDDEETKAKKKRKNSLY